MSESVHLEDGESHGPPLLVGMCFLQTPPYILEFKQLYDKSGHQLRGELSSAMEAEKIKPR
jgi:hypothetical protein